MNTLISIAMATYNGEKFIRKQLDSILNQSYKKLEIIICDDRSSDKTFEILEEYASKYSNIKIYKNEQNLGYVKNFEKVISLCSGEYIALADQDDIWFEDKIAILYSNIGDNLLIHSDCSLIDEADNEIFSFWKGEIYTHDNFDDFLYSNVVTGCSTLFSKKLLDKILPFPEGLAYHDWYLAIFAAKEGKIAYYSKPLFQYRQHRYQDTGAIAPNKYISLILDPIKRLFGIETRRKIGIRKQLKNLESLYHSNINNLSVVEKENLFEAMEYFQDYLKHYLHIKMFLIGCKYRKHKYRYGRKYNYLCIPNLMRELIG
jgi:glycosyltransferase involved in cell wall biosynthesis